MKKIIYSLLSVFMLFTGIIFTGCGGDDSSYTISFEQEVFTDANRNYIEIDLTDKKEGESVEVQLRATVDGKKEGMVIVNSNYENIVKASSAYNASLNYNTITLEAVSEGYAEIIVKGKAGNVQEEKLLVYAYSNVTGVSQKTDQAGDRKTQYILLGESVDLDNSNFLKLTARETCNRTEFDWSFTNNYGDSLSIEGSMLNLDAEKFNAYLKTEEGKKNGKKIVLTATSRYDASVTTQVELDVITGATVSEVQVAYTLGEFVTPDETNTKIVRTQGEAEKTVLYVKIDVVSDYSLSWLTLTDDVLYRMFGVPLGVLDITQHSYVQNDNVHTFILAIKNESSQRPQDFEIDFSFMYDEYDYEAKSNNLAFSLIDVVNEIKVLDEKDNLLNNDKVRVYNVYAEGLGQMFNVSLYPSTAENKEFYMYLRVENSLAYSASFNLANYIELFAENGNRIGFNKDDETAGYVYYKSDRNFADGTIVYAKAVNNPTDEIDLAFYSADNVKVNTLIDLSCEYAPEKDFDIQALSGETLDKKVETSENRELVVKFRAPDIAGIDVESLYLDYAESENFEIVSLSKNLAEIEFTIKVKKLNCDEDVQFTLYHKNGFKATSSINVKLFKALSSASVELTSSSSEVAKKESALQTFGAGEDLTLSNVIVPFGSTISYDYKHDAYSSLEEDVKFYFFVEGEGDLIGKKFETNEAFYKHVYNGNRFTCSTNTNYFILNQTQKTINFTTANTTFVGYLVVEFAGLDVEGNIIKLHRIVRLESYVPATTLSTENTYLNLVSSSSLSAESAEALSNKQVSVRFRHDQNAITYFDINATSDEDNYFTFRSIMGEQDSDYTWDGRQLKYNDEVVYSINDLTSANGKTLMFNIEAVSTGDFVEFMDTFVITYQSYNSTYRISFDIRIMNSERVEKVIWANATSDNTIYLLERSTEALNVENHQFSIITAVSDAYDQQLDFSYIGVEGKTNLVNFVTNGLFHNVVVNPKKDGEITGGGYGYIYIIPKDAVKKNNDVIYSYYENGVLKTTSVPKAWLNNEAPNGQKYFDFLYDNALFIANDGREIPYSNILIRISLVVADGKSESTALRIYNVDQLKKIDEYSHYILMNNLKLENWESLFSKRSFKGSLRGYTDKITITFSGENNGALFDAIASSYNSNGKTITPTVKDLVFNGTVKHSGFVANSNNGLIDNVVIDVYKDNDVYKSSTVASTDDNAGAIVGSNNGTIQNSKVLGVTVTSEADNSNVGGIAGYNSGVISNVAVEMYKFAKEVVNTFEGKNVGGFVGATNSNNAVIENSYIYDYALYYDTINDKNITHILGKGDANIGAFVGLIYNNTTPIVRNSFAVVGLTTTHNAEAGSGLTIEDVYNSYYEMEEGKTEPSYISICSEINSSLWIKEGQEGFDSTINGEKSHLTFSQAKPINLGDLPLKADYERMLVLDNDNKKVLLYYYDVTEENLTQSQKQILSTKNTYGLSDIFDNVDGEVVLISSAETVAITNLDAIEIVGTGSAVITIQSKHDFEKSITFEINVINVVADFKITHNGEEISMIEVQEGKNLFIDYSILDSLYLGGDGRQYNLVLEDIIFAIDELDEAKEGAKFIYSIDKNSAYIQAEYGAKDEFADGIYVNNFLQRKQNAEGIETLINEKLKDYFERKIQVVPFKGTERIDVYNSSIPLSPELSTSIYVDLVTDSEEDALIISLLENDDALALFEGGEKTNITRIEVEESGTFVFGFANQQKIEISVTRKGYNKSTKTHTYLLKINIHDTYKSKISSTEKYKLKFDAKNNQSSSLIKYVELVLEPQNINNIDLTNYKISQTSNINGRIAYTKTDTSVSVVAPGTKTILEATIDPDYSYYEQVRIEYSAPAGVGVTLSYLKKEDTIYGEKYFNVLNVENREGALYIPRTEDVSTYSFGIYTSSYISVDCSIIITVSFWGYNAERQLVKLGDNSYKLEVSCLPRPSVVINGQDSYAKLAKGSSISIDVNLENDQDLASLSLDGENLTGISLREETGNPVDNKNGTKTYKYQIVAGVNASVSGGVGNFTVNAMVERVINDLRETSTMSATVALVEFDVKSMQLEDTVMEEGSTIPVYTAYENIAKNLSFSYIFNPIDYSYDVHDDAEVEAVEELIEKRRAFTKQGYFADSADLDEATYLINYAYEDGEFSPIDIKDQLYLVGSSGREMKISWVETAETGKYTYTYQEGVSDRFVLNYNEVDHSFTITGKSTTSSMIILRVKNITYLEASGKNVYWESHYDFGIQVKSFTDEDAPQVIDSAEKFNAIQEEGEAKDYILMCDIELDDYKPFSTAKIKSFDGNGYTIHLNSFDTSEMTNAELALFTVVEENTLIKNVRVNWFKGGQITLDTTPTKGFTDITVAGFAIENKGVIYNSEVVAYNYKGFEEVPTDLGIVVNYTRNDKEYILDANSAGNDEVGVESRIAGFVYTNTGNITNSRVGGYSIRVIKDDSVLGIAEYEEQELDVFTISGQGQVSGFASANTKTIASSAVNNVQITNKAKYNKFETSGFVNLNSGKISTSYVQGHDDPEQPSVYVNLGSSIQTSGYAAGFVMNNTETGSISNALSNIKVATTSLMGSGFVYQNKGNIIYSFSASQVANASYLQMGFTGMDENGNLLSTEGKISYSYYYDMNFDPDTTIENVVDTGAEYLNLNMSNSTSNYYGFSFASGNKEDEMLENADGIWYMRDNGKLSLVEADTVAHSVRYIAANNKAENTFTFFYSRMKNRITDKYSETMIGTKNNPILIASAKDFDNAFGSATSTFVKQYIKGDRINGAYRFIKDIDVRDLGVNESGNVEISSTSKTLTNAQIDGNSFSIKNISINSKAKSAESGVQSFGLFANIENRSKVFNLGLEISNVSAEDVYAVGGLAGFVRDSYIVNVDVIQDYLIKSEEEAETSTDKVKGQNVVGGLAGVVVGKSIVKNVSISNPNISSSFYSSGRKIGEVNEHYYLRNISLNKIRTNLIADKANLSVFKEFSFAGGLVGFVDVYESISNYLFDSNNDFVRVFRISGLVVKDTVNIRGEVVGGLMGYTSPTTNVQNSSLTVGVQTSENKTSLISKILSYNSYAGGLVGLGSGYFFRVYAEYDSNTQASIESSYGNFYVGSFDSTVAEKRGSIDIFNTNYKGTISYDYSTQTIGGLIGTMQVGMIYNSYSKINVVAKPLSQTTAGGVIGKITSVGYSNYFNYEPITKANADGSRQETVQSTVVLKEVYASGDVRGGYDFESKTGYAGGIVGLLDTQAILSLESVNAVNAFDYDGVAVEAIEGKEDEKQGNLSSVGVYAFVGGQANKRGKVNIITPAKYSPTGVYEEPSKYTVGYYSYITNPDGDRLNIDMFEKQANQENYDRVEFVDKENQEDAQDSIIKIASLAEFTDVIDGFNTTSGAFLKGGHWSPENWEQENIVYPKIKYISIRDYVYLDADEEHRDQTIRKMNNSNIIVYVRGFDHNDGTYKDVDLTNLSSQVSGFYGQIIGPEGWLTEEDKEKGVVARKENGEYIGIKLRNAMFTNVKEGFLANNIKFYYQGNANGGERETLADASGGMFISNPATGIDLNGLVFNVSDANVTINSTNGSAGFICPSITDSKIANLSMNIKNSTFTARLNAQGNIREVNYGTLFGQISGDDSTIIEDNIINITSPFLVGLINITINAENATANIGALYGNIVSTPGEESTVTAWGPSVYTTPFNTENLEGELISVNVNAVNEINLGGQIGKAEGVSLVDAQAKAIVYKNKIRVEGNAIPTVNFGGILGNINNAKGFMLSGEGNVANTELLLGGAANTTISTLNAGGIFGSVSVNEGIFNIKASADSAEVGSVFSLSKPESSGSVSVGAGSVGGLLGSSTSAVNVSGATVELNVHGRNKATFENLGVKVGGIIAENESPIAINETKIKGYVDFTTTNPGNVSAGGFIGRVLNAGKFEDPISGEEYSSGIIDSTSEMTIKTNAKYIGGFVGYVASTNTTEPKEFKIEKSLYKEESTLQVYGTGEKIIGGLVGYIASSEGTFTTQDNPTPQNKQPMTVTISGSVFGGKILIDQETVDNNNISPIIGGIVGEAKFETGKQVSKLDVQGSLAYGDVVVKYNNDNFKQMEKYTFGGIVGMHSGNGSLTSNLSMMTNNNDRHKSTGVNIADAICGVYNNLSGISGNMYSHAVTLCATKCQATDVAYKTAYSGARKGYADSVDGRFAIGEAERIIENTNQVPNFETTLEAKKGSKLNPIVYSSDFSNDTTNGATGSNGMIYFVTENDINIDLSTKGLTSTYTIDKDKNGNTISESNRVTLSTAFIGDGFRINSTYKETDASGNESSKTVDKPISLIHRMYQNSFISSTVLDVDYNYDINPANPTTGNGWRNDIGAMVSLMEGGIIYACGVEGEMSVGAPFLIDIGGMVGAMGAGHIAESYTALNVTHRGAASGNVSGFVNIFNDYAFIDECFSTGKVTTYNDTGANAFGGTFANIQTHTRIRNCYTISLIDQNNYDGSTINSDTAAFGSWSGANAIFENCYYDSNVNGEFTGDKGSPSTKLDMQFNETTAPEEGFVGDNAAGYVTQYDADDYYNYGYPTRNIGYLKRVTVVVDDDVSYHLIPNATKLKQVQQYRKYKLEYDIDLSKSEFSGKSDYALIHLQFFGIIDGQNKTISHLKHKGLFSGCDGTIQNLRIMDAEIESTGNVGIVAPSSSSNGVTLRNIIVSGNIVVGNEQNGAVGGIIGVAMAATIENCKNYARIVSHQTNSYGVGGICGWLNFYSATVTNCVNYGTIQADSGSVGGIIGKASDSLLNLQNPTFKIQNCGNTNSVLSGYTLTSEDTGDFCAGGIVGSISIRKTKIDQCYNTAMIKAGNKNANSTINETVSAEDQRAYAGGIVGRWSNKTGADEVKNCLNQGVVEALGSVEVSTKENATATAEPVDLLSYQWDSNNLTLKYNMKSDGTVNIINVCADAFVGNVPNKATDSYNEGQIFRNGLFANWSYKQEEIKFNIPGSVKKGTSSNMFSFGDQTTETTANAWFKVGSTDDATVYISKTDDLGCPTHFYVTVPRTIHYPRADDFKIDITTRQQEIYSSYEIPVVTTTTATRYYDKAKQDNLILSNATAISNTTLTTTMLNAKDEGNNNIWDVYGRLTFMVGSSSIVEQKRLTTIGGETFALIANEKEFQQTAAGFHQMEIQIAGTEKIGGNNGKNVKDLIDAGYDFEIVNPSLSTSTNGVRLELISSSVDPGADVLYIVVRYTITANTYASANFVPKFTYKLKATKPTKTIEGKLKASSLVYDRSNNKTFIYLNNLVFNKVFDASVMKDGTKYTVTFNKTDESGNIIGTSSVINLTYNASSNRFEFNDAGNKCEDYKDCIISFNYEQNETIEEIYTYVGQFSTSSGYTKWDDVLETKTENVSFSNVNGVSKTMTTALKEPTKQLIVDIEKTITKTSNEGNIIFENQNILSGHTYTCSYQLIENSGTEYIYEYIPGSCVVTTLPGAAGYSCEKTYNIYVGGESKEVKVAQIYSLSNTLNETDNGSTYSVRITCEIESVSLQSSTTSTSVIETKTDSFGNEYYLYGKTELNSATLNGNEISINYTYNTENVIIDNAGGTATYSNVIVVKKNTSNQTQKSINYSQSAIKLEGSATTVVGEISSANQVTDLSSHPALQQELTDRAGSAGGIVITGSTNPAVTIATKAIEYGLNATYTINKNTINEKTESIEIERETQDADMLAFYYNEDGSMALTDGHKTVYTVNTGIAENFINVAGQDLTIDANSLVQMDFVNIDHECQGTVSINGDEKNTTIEIAEITSLTYSNYIYKFELNFDEKGGAKYRISTYLPNTLNSFWPDIYVTSYDIGANNQVTITSSEGTKTYDVRITASGTAGNCNVKLELGQKEKVPFNYDKKGTVTLLNSDGFKQSSVINVDKQPYGVMYKNNKFYFYSGSGADIVEQQAIDSGNYRYKIVNPRFQHKDDGSLEQITCDIEKYSVSRLREDLKEDVTIKGSTKTGTLFVNGEVDVNPELFIYENNISGVCLTQKDTNSTTVETVETEETEKTLQSFQDVIEVENDVIKHEDSTDEYGYTIAENDKKFVSGIAIEEMTNENGSTGFGISGTKVTIYENGGINYYDLIITYKEFNNTSSKTQYGGSIDIDSIQISGYIVQADVDLKTKVQNAPIKAPLYGNGYTINYYSNNSLFAKTNNIFDLNVAGVVNVKDNNSEVGMLSTKTEANINRLNTYGSIITTKGIKITKGAAGVVYQHNWTGAFAVPHTYTNVNSYVNFSTWSDTADGVNNFAGIIYSKNLLNLTNTTNYGTIIGYDGADGRDGTTTWKTLITYSNGGITRSVKSSCQPTSGEEGQSVSTISTTLTVAEKKTDAYNKNAGVVKAGHGGIKGKGCDTPGGEDSTSNDHKTAVQTSNSVSSGSGGTVDGVDNTTQKSSAVSTFGCTGWNGLNFKKYELTDIEKMFYEHTVLLYYKTYHNNSNYYLDYIDHNETRNEIAEYQNPLTYLYDGPTYMSNEGKAKKFTMRAVDVDRSNASGENLKSASQDNSYDVFDKFLTSYEKLDSGLQNRLNEGYNDDVFIDGYYNWDGNGDKNNDDSLQTIRTSEITYFVTYLEFHFWNTPGSFIFYNADRGELTLKGQYFYVTENIIGVNDQQYYSQDEEDDSGNVKDYTDIKNDVSDDYWIYSTFNSVEESKLSENNLGSGKDHRDLLKSIFGQNLPLKDDGGKTGSMDIDDEDWSNIDPVYGWFIENNSLKEYLYKDGDDEIIKIVQFSANGMHVYSDLWVSVRTADFSITYYAVFIINGDGDLVLDKYVDSYSAIGLYEVEYDGKRYTLDINYHINNAVIKKENIDKPLKPAS